MRVPMSDAAAHLLNDPARAKQLSEKIRQARQRHERTVHLESDGAMTITEVGSGSVSPQAPVAARPLPPPMKFKP
jgi:hypothetical protein